LKAIVGTVGSALVLFFTGLFGDAIKLNDASRASALCIGALLFPTYLAIDMFYKGAKAGKDLKSKSDAAIAERDALSAPPLQRAEISDAQEALCDILRASVGKDPTCWAGFIDWYATTLARLRGVLNPMKWHELEKVAQPYLDGGVFSNTSHRHASAFRDCIGWLERASGDIKPEHINRNFRVPV
jgi:hypothetical protein